MNDPTSFQKLGEFIVSFQHTEAAVTELLVLMARADDESVRILVNDIENGRRLKTADALFSHFVDLQPTPDESTKRGFHKLMVDLEELGQVRNNLVHSRYHLWINVEGEAGLLRKNSKLRTSRREESEEELLPRGFDPYINRLEAALKDLEHFRLRVIDWLHPI